MSLLQQLDQLPPPPYSHQQPFNDLKLPDLPADHIINSSPPQLPTLEPLLSLNMIPNGFDSQANTLPKPLSVHSRSDIKSVQLPRIHSLIPGDLSSPTDVTSVATIDEYTRRRGRSVSTQDADDRMAAEALCGLGKVESNHSQNSYESASQHHRTSGDSARERSSHEEPEPLLSLLKTSHPWLGGTINGSLSAYSSTKQYSPRFIQYGAEFVERNIGTPVASTVGTVGRKTGVEGSIRRFLGSRRPSELDQIDPEILGQDVRAKRRRRDSEDAAEMDLEYGVDGTVHRTESGHSSIDTLPAYDENKSPAYEENTAVVDTPNARQMHFRPTANRSWSTQLMISTSGLGAALNEASLRSLKYCLDILRSANMHVRNLMEALRRLLSAYDRAPRSTHQTNGHTKADGTGSSHHENAMQLDPAITSSTNGDHINGEETAESIAQKIQHLNDEIWNTLKTVVSNVSRYTGGALPERTSGFVKSQLMSVPRRWQRAVVSSSSSSSSSSSAALLPEFNHVSRQGDHDAVCGAHRMLAFAMEGLDMMDQVGGAVDDTIVSAEGWLESMGRRKAEAEGGRRPSGVEAEGRIGAEDVKMGVEIEGAGDRRLQSENEVDMMAG